MIICKLGEKQNVWQWTKNVLSQSNNVYVKNIHYFLFRGLIILNISYYSVTLNAKNTSVNMYHNKTS